MKYLIFYMVSLLLGGAGAWCVVRWGSDFGFLDKANDRSSHSGNVPIGGGIGILIVFIFSSFVLDIPLTFWIPALFLSGVSLFGDKIELSVKFRLIIQFSCTSIFLINLFYSAQVHLFTWFLFVPLSIFIVGTSNFYNFMDGIDAIAGITGVFAFSLIAVFGYISSADTNYIVLTLAIAFSCAGFLLFNIPKAKVFMGDIGSVLLGFVFACMVVLLSRTFLEFICLAGFLFHFYADGLITMFVRIKNGDSLRTPHRRHIYQLLANEYKIDHWKISTVYGVIQLVFGVAIIFLKNYGYIPILSLLLLSLFCFSIFSVFIRKRLRS